MFHSSTGRVAALVVLLSTSALAQTGYAASYVETIQRGAKTYYKPSLAELTQSETASTTRTLDWQQPSIALYFDLPPADRTSNIVLTLSADPLTRVAKNAPLEVQFNNSKPVPIRSNGRGFDVRIPFSAMKARPRRNVIRITYPVPNGADCVAPAHGAWSIDLAASKLQMSGRALRRNMSLTEVSELLSEPALSPKRVGLIARGPAGTDMQALAAQAISLRTPHLPKFSVQSRGNDLNVIMVKRDRLYTVTNDPMILNSKGARIFVPRGRPTKLIFTADTDGEILSLLRTFASRKLPNTSRPISSLGEIYLQNHLDSETVKVDGKTPLSNLAIASNIAHGAQSYKFGVLDPAASNGEIRLKLSSSKNMPETSKLRVALNGKVLGATKLDKKRKTVAFDVEAGTLNATSNILNIVPDLDAPKGYACPSPQAQRPNFSIGNGSRLILNADVPSPLTELSSLTSTGGLFAQSESYIALPKGTRDYQASLRILGRMAKSAGHGLTLADYSRGAHIPTDKHRLIIGPSGMAKAHISGAPKALREALSGQSTKGENLLQANFESYASAGSTDDAVRYAVAQTKPRRLSRGGIAALYGSGDGQLTGVISSAPGESFLRASSNLVELKHWNALQGGVARWTSSSVIMAQTAQSDIGIQRPILRKTLELPDLGFDWPEWSEIEWPEIDFSDFDTPQVTLPEITWPDITWPDIAWSDLRWPSYQFEKSASVEPVKSVEKARVEVTPKLKPRNLKPRTIPKLFKAKTAPGLRGPIQFSTDKDTSFISFDRIRKFTRTNWVKTKAWFNSQSEGLRSANPRETQVAQTPAKESVKAAWMDKLPKNGLVQIGDRSVSIYGLLLIGSFMLILLLMTLSSPKARSENRP